MKPEAQRIAIAEACGMKWCRIGTEDKLHRMLCWWNPIYEVADMSEPICNPAYMWEHGRVPDYLTDLNAMHEAEGVFSGDDELTRYEDALWEVAGGSYLRATAAQRAEAFLRTLGKWEAP